MSVAYNMGNTKLNSARSHIVHRHNKMLTWYIHLYATVASTSGHSITFKMYTSCCCCCIIILCVLFLIDSNICFLRARHNISLFDRFIFRSLRLFMVGVRNHFMYFVISIMLRMCELINSTIQVLI